MFHPLSQNTGQAEHKGSRQLYLLLTERMTCLANCYSTPQRARELPNMKQETDRVRGNRGNKNYRYLAIKARWGMVNWARGSVGCTLRASWPTIKSAAGCLVHLP